MFLGPSTRVTAGTLAASLLLGCRPPLPPDIKTLSERTEQLEFVRVGVHELFIDWGHGKRFVIGPYELEARWRLLRNSNLAVTIAEQGKTLASLSCSYDQRVLLDRPPTYTQSLKCEDPSRGYHLDWSFSDHSGDSSCSLWASKNGEKLYSRWCGRQVRVRRPNTNYSNVPSAEDTPLVAALVLEGDDVIMFVPVNEPDRELARIFLLLVLVKSR